MLCPVDTPDQHRIQTARYETTNLNNLLRNAGTFVCPAAPTPPGGPECPLREGVIGGMSIIPEPETDASGGDAVKAPSIIPKFCIVVLVDAAIVGFCSTAESETAFPRCPGELIPGDAEVDGVAVRPGRRLAVPEEVAAAAADDNDDELGEDEVDDAAATGGGRKA
ncbi:hypothetical protein QFC19_001914 [Naganishia cerealis]|uniref:Uncharacterized protein n=1 Tax=Naganishia cerealis TaxID=610337 RepID=A0ACC2WEQ7_9TREE|nr:hypothetical protein QFC19_001914 [Naganishia cerealis]